MLGSTDSRWRYGDAVIVDLGEKGKLFALLRSGRDQYHSLLELPYDIYEEHLAPKWSWRAPEFGEPTKFDRVKALGAAGRIEYRPDDEVLFAQDIKNGKRPASKTRPDGSRASYVYPPKLVMFRDIKDHNTLRQIDGRFLHAEFGPGVRLKSITAEPTLDPRTHNGIENIVPIPSPRYKPSIIGREQRHWELYVDDFKGD